MSELVVDLTDPQSIALARQVLDALGNDWPPPTTSAASADLLTGSAGGSASASAEPVGSSQSDSKADDYDPWATSAQSTETPRAAVSEPSEPSSGDTDDDNPFE